MQGPCMVVGTPVADSVADRLARRSEEHLGGQWRQRSQRLLIRLIDLPVNAVQLRSEVIHQPPERPEQPATGRVQGDHWRQLSEETSDLAMSICEQFSS